MMNVAYVVLHYKNVTETNGCVDSILQSQAANAFRIMIVDNGSNDGTREILIDRYQNNPLVTLVTSDSNLGFACGLNLGISTLRNDGWKGFIVLLNNDTIISQGGWQDIINQKYEQYHFGVLGPDIVDLTGRHANPFIDTALSSKSIKRLIDQYKRDYLWTYLYLNKLLEKIRALLIKCYIKPIRFIKQKLFGAREITIYDNAQEQTNVTLQGSCLILSPRYFDFFDGLYSKTFLYYEEAVLRWRCDVVKIPSVYTPDLKILHMEGKTTQSITKTARKKNLFFYSNSIRSLKQIYKDIIEYETNNKSF